MRLVIVVVCLTFCATVAGCRLMGGGRGAAGTAAAAGHADRTYWHDMDLVWYAALATLDDMHLTQGYQKRDQLKGRIQRRTESGDRIRITLTRMGTATEVNVRVNRFGDKALSAAIYEGLERHLSPRPPEFPVFGAADSGAAWPSPHPGGAPAVH